MTYELYLPISHSGVNNCCVMKSVPNRCIRPNIWSWVWVIWAFALLVSRISRKKLFWSRKCPFLLQEERRGSLDSKDVARGIVDWKIPTSWKHFYGANFDQTLFHWEAACSVWIIQRSGPNVPLTTTGTRKQGQRALSPDSFPFQVQCLLCATNTCVASHLHMALLQYCVCGLGLKHCVILAWYW